MEEQLKHAQKVQGGLLIEGTKLIFLLFPTTVAIPGFMNSNFSFFVQNVKIGFVIFIDILGRRN